MKLTDIDFDQVSYYTHHSLVIFSIGCWIVLISVSLLAWYITANKHKPAQILNRRKQLPLKELPFVSVIRPLSGTDYKLYENLETSFLQDYPNFELIFSVASSLDPSIEIVNKLIQKYPKVQAKLVIDGKEYGDNPKINNLIKAYNQSKYDILWVCDSNIYLNPGCLSRSIQALESDPKVGLVHHLPVGIQAKNFGAMLDTLFLNTCHAKQYTVINYLKLSCCVVGKSCIYRKPVLEKCGGLMAASKYLAEDYFLANNVLKLGYKHVMIEDLVYQPVGNMSLVSFFQRRSRWIRLRKYVSLLSILLEPLSDCIINGIIASYGFSTVFKVHPLNFFAFHLVIWFLIDLMIFQTLQGSPVKDLKKFMVAWGFREITSFPLLLYSVAGSNLCWRGTTYFITTDTKVLYTKQVVNKGSGLQSNDSELEIQQHPLAKHLIQIALSAIQILADILHKSQRNGIKQPEGNSLQIDTKNLLTFLVSEEEISPTNSTADEHDLSYFNCNPHTTNHSKVK